MSETVNRESQDDDYRAYLAQGEFRLQCCTHCGYPRYPARWICPECLSEEFQWKPMSGIEPVPRRVASARPNNHGSNCQSPRAQR